MSEWTVRINCLSWYGATEHSSQLYVLMWVEPILQAHIRTGGLSKGENFHEFRGFVAIRESFLREIWGVVSFGVAKASNPRKFSLQKSNYYQFAKVFSLESFPLYGITKQGTSEHNEGLCKSRPTGSETHLRKEMWSNQF